MQRGFTSDQIADRVVPALTYTENMQPDTGLRVFSQTWSLGVEEQFYLVWPLALPWVLSRARPRLVLAVAMAGSAAVMIVWFHDWLPMHAYALLAGCLLALAGPLVARWWLVPAGAVGLAVAIHAAPGFERIYVYGPMLATPAAMLLVAGAAGGNRVLELSVLRFLGRISYAVYLWHVPLLVLAGATYGRGATLVPLAVTLVMAVASTFAIEEPLRRAWRHRHQNTVSPRHALT